MSGWAHRGYSVTATPTPMAATPDEAATLTAVDVALHQHRWEAERSPAAILADIKRRMRAQQMAVNGRHRARRLRRAK